MDTDRCTRSGDGDQGTKATGEKEGRAEEGEGGQGAGEKENDGKEPGDGLMRSVVLIRYRGSHPYRIGIHLSCPSPRAARFPLVILRICASIARPGAVVQVRVSPSDSPRGTMHEGERNESKPAGTPPSSLRPVHKQVAGNLPGPLCRARAGCMLQREMGANSGRGARSRSCPGVSSSSHQSSLYAAHHGSSSRVLRHFYRQPACGKVRLSLYSL